MSHSYLYYGDIKKQIRELVLSKKTPAKVYLCMPARECLCVQQALSIGSISLQTRIVYIEGEEKDYYAIADKLHSLGFINVHGINKWFEKIKDRDWRSRIGDTKVDLAFIDLCGMVTPKRHKVIQSLQPYLASDTKISITFLANVRGGISSKQVSQYFLSRKSLRKYKGKDRGMGSDMYLGGRIMPVSKRLVIGNFRYTRENVVTYTTALLHDDLFGCPNILHNHYSYCIQYKDNGKSSNMATVILQ